MVPRRGEQQPCEGPAGSREGRGRQGPAGSRRAGLRQPGPSPHKGPRQGPAAGREAAAGHPGGAAPAAPSLPPSLTHPPAAAARKLSGGRPAAGHRGRAGGARRGRAPLGASCLTARPLPSLRTARPAPSGTFKRAAAGPPPRPPAHVAPRPGPAGRRPAGAGSAGGAAPPPGPGAAGSGRGGAGRPRGNPRPGGPGRAGPGLPAVSSAGGQRGPGAAMPCPARPASRSVPSPPGMGRPRLFGRLRAAVLGVVHVAALPGTPRSSLPLTQIIDQACQEAEIYKDAGVDGLIVENMHDRPYTLCPGPEVTAVMTAISAAVRRSCPHLALGVQVLSAANQQAIAVALAAGLDFIRAEGFVFSHVADEGIINACAGNLLRYRKQVGAENIQIFADIKKKHSAHTLTADVGVAETAAAAELFLADGLVLTGKATGLPTDPGELKEVQHAVKIPVLIGSGVTMENVNNYVDANALIIGSYFKKGGYWANSVDPERVKKFMDHISKLRE